MLPLFCAVARSDQTLLADADAKAGLVFQFARYAEWPPAVLREGIQICITGNQDSFQQSLLGLTGKPLRARPLTVRVLGHRDDPAGCHIMVIGDGKEPIGQWLNRARPINALTISDETGFIAAGGMIGLVMAGDKVRFEINVEAMSAAGIGLPAQVVRLARNYTGRSE
ncbi:MAG: YfiR family protein [Rhodocyclaceae bacterium]